MGVGSALETLAARLEPVSLAAGEEIVRDRCYLVAEGEILLSKRTGWQMSMGPGGFFGEIALPRDTPRTATAHAAGPGLLLALDRADFLAAVGRSIPRSQLCADCGPRACDQTSSRCRLDAVVSADPYETPARDEPRSSAPTPHGRSLRHGDVRRRAAKAAINSPRSVVLTGAGA